MHIGIYINTSKDKCALKAKEFTMLLAVNKISYTVCDNAFEFFERINVDSFENIMKKAELIIVFGGDGTMLNVMKSVAGQNLPILGINMGKVGFLTDATVNDFAKVIEMIKGGFTTSDRVLLEAEINNSTYRAVNEVVVSRIDHTVSEVELYIDGVLADEIVADGVIIATPTGSTAYSLSAGGPVLSPENNSLVITQICAHNLHTRPIVITDNHKISIKHKAKNYKNLAIVIDGHIVETMDENSIVNIRKSEISTKLVEFNRDNFYSKLLKKL